MLIAQPNEPGGSNLILDILPMNIIIYLRDLIVSLLSNLGLSQSMTGGLADVSLVAIGLGLLIAFPEVWILAVIVLLVALAINH